MFTVNPAGLNYLVLSPASSTVTAGTNVGYTAEGFDQYGNDLGDVTAATTFSINNADAFTGNSLAAQTAGVNWTVTGADGAAQGTATLTVNPVGLNYLVLSPASSTVT